MGTSEPGGRAPAPEPIRLVQRFVNSNDREGEHERLPSPAELRCWLEDAGLGTVAVDAAGHERAVAFREALRGLLLANNGAAIDEAAVATFNDVAARARLTVRVAAPGGAALVPQAAGVDGALGRLVAIVYAAIETGTWPRLKACRRDVCQWAFYDHSKNRSGTWCTMGICGNRVKTSMYWRRRHARL